MTRHKPPAPRHETTDAWERALGLLAVRARSEAEMAHRLESMGFDAPMVQRTLARLRSRRLLDDVSLARDWIGQRIRHGRSGPLLLQRELTHKGIDPSLVNRLIEESFSEGREALRARELLEKNFGPDELKDARVLRRALALLQRRGYHEDVIGDLLDNELRRATESSGG